MTIVLRPGQFPGEPHPVGKLATTLLSVTLAGMADPPRFRRGKGYVADHAVTRLEVSTGVLKGWVAGSRPDPYEVIVSTNVVERPPLGNADSLRPLLAKLTPDGGDLLVSCTCPDWDDPCKHAVATLLAFAAELTPRPELLLEWRCEPADGPVGRPGIGSRATGSSRRHLRLAPTPAAPEPGPAEHLVPTSPYATPEWQAFLGTVPFPDPPEVPPEPTPAGHSMLGTIDVGRLVQSALDVFLDLN